MQVCRTVQEVSFPASVCALGMFDGVHVGHAMVLENALRESRLLGVPGVVFSFANHPQSLISRTPTRLLSSLEERLEAFQRMGFDCALIPDFDEWMKNLPAENFIQDILKARLGVRSVTVGYDHRFGRNREGDGAGLTRAGKRDGFDVQIIAPVRITPDNPIAGGQIISSTLIRKLLTYGDIEQANLLLGHPYRLSGPVVSGLQRGRELGFPTANLAPDAERLVPANGTYSGYAELGLRRYPAVCNIGLCPTFGDQSAQRVEVHLLGYEGADFYGETLKMFFLQKLRDEQAFPSVEALIHQIEQDCRTARKLLAGESPQSPTEAVSPLTIPTLS